MGLQLDSCCLTAHGEPWPGLRLRQDEISLQEVQLQWQQGLGDVETHCFGFWEIQLKEGGDDQMIIPNLRLKEGKDMEMT